MVNPNRFAIEPQLEVAPEETGLDQETVPDEGPSDAIDLVYGLLRDHDEAGVRIALTIARALQGMVNSAQGGNEKAMQHWRRMAISAIDQLPNESGEGDVI
jgi:hypothetical protein